MATIRVKRLRSLKQAPVLGKQEKCLPLANMQRYCPKHFFEEEKMFLKINPKQCRRYKYR